MGTSLTAMVGGGVFKETCQISALAPGAHMYLNKGVKESQVESVEAEPKPLTNFLMPMISYVFGWWQIGQNRG